jgi:hypothetical protein
MFTLWREGRRLRREFAAFNKKWRRLNQEKVAAERPYSILTDEGYNSEYQRLRHAVQDNESKRLLRWANRLGIDVYSELPQNALDSLGQLMWWDEDEKEFLFFRSRLSYRGAARLSKMIKEKQYEVAKKWTDLLAPVLSTVISLIALIISIVALYRT